MAEKQYDQRDADLFWLGDENARLRGALKSIANRPCFTELLGDDLGGEDCGCPSCTAQAALETDK